jgi:hypothetical protein
MFVMQIIFFEAPFSQQHLSVLLLLLFYPPN